MGNKDRDLYENTVTLPQNITERFSSPINDKTDERTY